MQLKEFQVLVLKRLSEHLKMLKYAYSQDTRRLQELDPAGRRRCHDSVWLLWRDLYDANKVPHVFGAQGRIVKDPYVHKHDGRGYPIPNLCLKVPTGGGKTLLGVSGVERIANDYFNTHTGLVVWMVPTDAIYQQTLKNFQNREHPYRQVLERAAAGRLKIFQKNSSFSKHDLQNNLCVMLLMLQSANRETKESLKLFQDSGQFLSFFPPSYDYRAHKKLLAEFPNLVSSEQQENSPTVHVPNSLGNVIRMSQPIIVLDEGHRAYSEQARNTVNNLNPRFILELSATPNIKERQSNVLVDVSGAALKQDEMIKLPIHIINSRGGNWKKTLHQACDKLDDLQRQAQQYKKQSDRFIRPIMLVQVERTGKEQRHKNFIHSEDVREYLVDKMGAHKGAVKVKASGCDELKDENLLHPNSQVRFIITKQALQEGWDCPFAYVLVVLSQSKSKLALTQLVGRILRQPGARVTGVEALDSCYVFCCHPQTNEVVKNVQKALQREGMADLSDAAVLRIHEYENQKIKTSRRRSQFKNLNIFLPRVLHKHKGSWRDIVYEQDVLKSIDFSQLQYRKKNVFRVGEQDFTSIEHIKIDVKIPAFRPNPPSLGSKKTDAPVIDRQHIDTTHEVMAMDFVHMVRRLSNTLPNPVIAAQLLDDTIISFKARGFSEQQIYRHRESILNSIEDDLLEQINTRSEQIFAQKLAQGELCFKIFKNKVNLNWELGQEFNFVASRETPIYNGPIGGGVQLSLFDMYSSHHFNQLEDKIAGYLDEHKAVKWWHRMVAKKDYRLQGWQKNKVYPDFLACVDGRRAKKVAVLEAKGQHLVGNDDTVYKKKLFQLLEKQASLDVGKLETASEDETQMVFRILMEKTWEHDAGQALN